MLNLQLFRAHYITIDWSFYLLETLDDVAGERDQFLVIIIIIKQAGGVPRVWGYEYNQKVHGSIILVY